jgi:hypothetical protein
MFRAPSSPARTAARDEDRTLAASSVAPVASGYAHSRERRRRERHCERTVFARSAARSENEVTLV